MENKNISLIEEQIRLEKNILKELAKGNYDILNTKNENIFLKSLTSNTNQVKNPTYLDLIEKNADMLFYERIKEKVKMIPNSNGTRYYDKYGITIGIVCDEMIYKSYSDVANMIYITPDNYKKYMDKLDIFMMVSTWQGLKKEWYGLGNVKSQLRKKAIEIMEEYKKQGIKVVYYSKEDPVNYDIFLDLAKPADYIFTTATEKIDDYKKHCNTENVWNLNFGINPQVHNPIGFRKYHKRNEVIFSGSWYKKYPEREKNMEMIFDGVIGSEKQLRIIDRNFSIKFINYFYPNKYTSYISPEIDYDNLLKVNKLFNWGINFNTIIDSNTMFANRVYEMQASGNLILSNYSVGVNNQFPNVFLINDSGEIKYIVDGYSKENIYEQQIWGIRRVMSNETNYERIGFVMDKLGHKMSLKKRCILVIVPNKNQHILKCFSNQNYKDKEVVEECDLEKINIKEYDFVTYFNEDSEYHEFYLEDMINAFKYTDVDFVTKDAFIDNGTLVTGIEHDYIDFYKSKYRTVFSTKNYTKFIEIKMEGKGLGYSIDHFEYKKGISFKNIEISTNLKLSVIIAAYNNGDHLLNKCFNSLLRSSMFEELEVIIVDDGSTDNYTPAIIRRLERQYSNVKAYFYNDGGSGSASRPRNKGIELSTTNYITYLDPDNEAVNDGYFKLYKSFDKKVDMVIGNMPRITTSVFNADYYKLMMNINKGKNVYDGNKKDFMRKNILRVHSIQALIVRKDIITKNNLKMIEGALGEDSLFFIELVMNCDSFKAINEDIHIYYAEVEGSSVNAISKRFYEKYLILEKQRIGILKQYDLLDLYLETRYEVYFKGWYLDKFKKVIKGDEKDALKILRSIHLLYKDLVEIKSGDFKKFIDLLINEDYDEILKIDLIKNV